MGEVVQSQAPGGIVFDGRRIRVRVETLEQGSAEAHGLEIVESPAAAAVVPILLREADGVPLVVLVEQERPAVGQRTLELPAGLLDAGEEPAAAARRELHEETGYDAAQLEPLGTIYSSPGFTDETLHLFLARGLMREGASEGAPDRDEITGVRTMPLAVAIARAESGALRDAKTITGLLLARAALQRDTSSPAAATGGPAMPFDASNIPQSLLGGATAARAAAPGELSLENILTQEFNYASVTAYQAMEDRARIFNLYLLLVGVLASALTAVFQLGGRQFGGPIFAILLFLAGFLGVVFFTQIVQLRIGYRKSLIAMNVIKEYYLKQLLPVVPDAERAFYWRLRTIPAGERAGSVTYWITLTIAFIGSLCFAACSVVLAQLAQDQYWVAALPPWSVVALAAVVLLASLLLHARHYRRKLSKKAEEQVIAEEEALIGPTTRQ
jgi:ADP-ribose pyrophosphatase